MKIRTKEIVLMMQITNARTTTITATWTSTWYTTDTTRSTIRVVQELARCVRDEWKGAREYREGPQG
ncbi:MAG: hypothetical protein J5I53_09620 [Bradyrhizobiaceae bacterium]|nr:hypothetical protein [Bradyrhizobiaceae bacterium]